MSTLFVTGFDDLNRVRLQPLPSGRARMVADGCCGIHGKMDFAEREVEAIALFGISLKNHPVQVSSNPKLIFNEISDPDSHSKTLMKCEELVKKLGVPVLNNPKSIRKTTRDSISNLLQDIPNLYVPKTIRVTPKSPDDIYTEIASAGLSFPVIVRTVGSHGGKTTILIEGREDYEKLHVYAFDGSDFYLTEYVDYASEDGLYRKYRIVVIDGVPLFRHHLINTEWMIHASSERFMESNKKFMMEARARRQEFDDLAPKISPAIDQITERLGLEYYGIDCNINDKGEILVFEVNANMNILSNNLESLSGQIELIKTHVLKLIDGRNQN